MKKSSVFHFILWILNDKRVMNRFVTTNMRDKDSNVTATYNDCIDVIEKLYVEAKKEE